VAKGLATILFSFFILIMNMQSGLHLFVYEIAKPIIIKNYCVNVDKPELKCDGKCHLKTVLLEEETNTNDVNSTNIPPPEVKFETTHYFTPIDLVYNDDVNNGISFAYRMDVLYLSRETQSDVFRPPIA